MARSNKYTSLNFNGIFEKKLSGNNSSSSSAANSSAKSFSNQSRSALSNSRIHGHMLVLTRPTPKPVAIPPKSEIKEQISPISTPPAPIAPAPPSPEPIKAGSEPDSISLRPQGRTGSAPVLSSSPLASPPPSKFVPPHLRPGFAGREERPGPELGKRGHRQPGQDPGNYGSIEGRPKSGSGYDPVRRGRELSDLNRPGSSGGRPNSSG